MNLMRTPLLLVFLFVPIVSFAQPSGCVVEDGKIKKLDPACNCLKTKKCYQGKKIKDDPKFFASIKGKSWIKYEEKELLKKSHSLHNEITDFKARGLVQTREARETYKQLRDTTVKLEALQKEQREKYSKRIEEKNKSLGITIESDNTGYMDRVLNFLAKPFEQLSSKTTGIASNARSNLGKTSTTVRNSPKQKKLIQDDSDITSHGMGVKTSESITNFEKKNILEKLKKERLSNPETINPKEEDSLFTKISKAYLRVAYDLLLEPSEE